MNSEDRKRIVKAMRCFHSLDAWQACMATLALVGLKRIQDAAQEHQVALAAIPGRTLPLLYVPNEHRGVIASDAAAREAFEAVQRENPSLENAFQVLWPGALDREVHEASTLLQATSWRTRDLLTGDIDVLGEAYEAMQSETGARWGTHRGEYFTPTNVVKLMVALNDPRPFAHINDPACGSGRMLLETAAHLIRKHGYFVQETGADHPAAGHILLVPPPALFVGQDIAATGPAMGRISLTCLGYANSVFVVRDTLRAPVTQSEVELIVEGRSKRLMELHAQRAATWTSTPSPVGVEA